VKLLKPNPDMIAWPFNVHENTTPKIGDCVQNEWGFFAYTGKEWLVSRKSMLEELERRNRRDERERMISGLKGLVIDGTNMTYEQVAEHIRNRWGGK
jgi:hypothetical protein